MTLSRPALPLLLMALAGCQQPVTAPAGGTGAAVAARPAASAAAKQAAARSSLQIPTLAGAWRVAGIDGVDLDQPVGLALRGDDRQLWWEPRCAGAARVYRIDSGRISFGSTQPPRPVGAPTPPVCTIALPPRLDDVLRALDDATHVSRTASNGILISGPSHSLTLYSQ